MNSTSLRAWDITCARLTEAYWWAELYNFTSRVITLSYMRTESTTHHAFNHARASPVCIEPHLRDQCCSHFDDGMRLEHPKAWLRFPNNMPPTNLRNFFGPSYAPTLMHANAIQIFI
ncbi:uncharacterized protein MYCFIDRAFT_170393 [Pseudocercospora fijiensis CIRAD86]|uniref:Uncharacterized protein n=1 Tax=Pseudocercospora fijiensis (strain CIRAD86) TaxID=383855 RepID=N1QC18_PSEFD|nr:uncharacterized protein MYCFIDRAFT_170393 [Pseudocercospora fijiensis CIRAD86]EME88818.1 hypothetical protein MYCFIDRAFT_170393 [Pseudocercospora fijiensis CIRAD86]